MGYDEDFQTAREPNPVFCHQDFLLKLAEYRNQPVGKRASLLMQRLAVDERRQHYKSTRGVNQGWRRSRLGGQGGNQFYAWWAPSTAAPFRQGTGFRSAPEGAIILRDIRHHDDHSPAGAQSFQDHYLPVTVREMRRQDYGPEPYTVMQSRFAFSREAVRILKGHPGSGKTTALLHAADTIGAERILYVTYSSDLAALARQYFDRYCSRRKQFHVVTYQNLLRRMLKTDAPPAADGDLRGRFRADLSSFSRSLGPWSDHLVALYDEMHAHLVGAALPIKLGRFEECKQPRVSEKNYLLRRSAYLGEAAARTVTDLAARLERADGRPLADRYFPELALAWRAAGMMAARNPVKAGIPETFLDFGAIVVDECQDLTPIEAFVLAELAAAITRTRAMRVPIFLAGDEAQTVRPTDFEWGWLNDILHARVGRPAEHKLATNLRSPRTIAELVNRVWDLYREIGKRDRPSGTGYAEIEDDATDQLFYCTAAPGEDLSRLVADLAGREGLALVSLDGSLPEGLPEAVRGAVLTPSEIKGLDFHTVCVLNGGRQLDYIQSGEDSYRFSASDIEGLRRRLAIDRLRVAVSRPSERLIWLDVNPSPKTVLSTLQFLNRGQTFGAVSQVVPEALMTALGEEQLEVEERIQRCQQDARQYLGVKPDLAFSRAKQAVSLLGNPGNPAAVVDMSVRDAAHLTLAEICFTLAFRGQRLSRELGNPDLFSTAAHAAYMGRKPELELLIRNIRDVVEARPEARLGPLGELAQSMAQHRKALEPWLMVELGGVAMSWVEELEGAITAGDNAAVLPAILPPFYDALGLPDASQRSGRLRKRALQILTKTKKFEQALAVLKGLPERDFEQEGLCLQAMGEYRTAAEVYEVAGNLKEALACYRSIPDFDAAWKLIGRLGDHPAAESYEWLTHLRELVAKRPEKFNRVMLGSEKKVLEEILEAALGVKRRKPAPRKTAAPQAPAKPRAPRKKAPKPPF